MPETKRKVAQRLQVSASVCHKGLTLGPLFGASPPGPRLLDACRPIDACSFDGKYFASLGGQDDNSVVIWETDTGRAVCGSPAAQDSALCVRWLHRRNDRFVTAGNFHLRVWQVDVSIPKASERGGTTTVRQADAYSQPGRQRRQLEGEGQRGKNGEWG